MRTVLRPLPSAHPIPGWPYDSPSQFAELYDQCHLRVFRLRLWSYLQDLLILASRVVVIGFVAVLTAFIFLFR